MVQFVTNEDLLKAYVRWAECAPFLLRGSEWEHFLGFPDGYSGMRPGVGLCKMLWEVPDIGAQRVRMLCDSPHWRAMLKVIHIQDVEAMFG